MKTIRPAARAFLATVGVAIFLTTAAVVVSPPAIAQTCTYELSPPQLTTLSGGVQVTASLAPKSCDGTAQPWMTTVCVSSASSPGRCETTNAWSAARVFVDPTDRDGYLSYGKGCVNSGKPPTTTCTDYGPLHSLG
jgi:hypothetical protein